MTLSLARRPEVALAPPPALRGIVLVAGGIVALAAAQGGFFASAWHAGTIGFAAAAALVWLFTDERSWSRMELVPFGLLAAYGAWSLISASWSVAPGASTHDVQRTLLYLAATAAFLAAADGLAAGVVCGSTVVAVWSLGDRLAHGSPWRAYEGRLLTGPIGYANGLGALMAIGAAVALALAIERRHVVAALPLLVLLPALALTDSRGADLAFLVGALVATGRRRIAAGAVAAGAVALTALLVWTPHRAGDRAVYWSVARHVGASHPLAGTGVGTFANDYARLPAAHDAHSLYLQALAELGIIGLLLVIALFAVPLAIAIARGRSAPAAGLAVYALAAGVDWDWQLPAVTVAALALAAAAVRTYVRDPARGSRLVLRLGRAAR